MTSVREDLIQELINQGIAGGLNSHGAAHGLEPLSWRLDLEFEPILTGEHPGGVAAPGAKELCDQWGELLELDPPTAVDEAQGFRAWSADVTDWTLTVFCVTSEERYRAAFPSEDS